MATTEDYLRKLFTQTGLPYVYGAELNLNDPNSRHPEDCCLAGDTLVHTENRGPVPISEIEPWDAVWAWHDGNLRRHKVTGVLEQPVQQLYRLRTRNRAIRATANHPFLVMSRPEQRRRNPAGGWCQTEWSTVWKQLDEIERGNLIVTLHHHPVQDATPTLLNGTPVTDEVAWLLGVITGDGHVGADGFMIAVFGEQRDEVSVALERIVGKPGIPSDRQGLVVHSVAWRDVLRAAGFDGVTAHTKRVPPVIMQLGASGQRSFLAGYAFADGHMDRRGHQTYSSCNRTLLAEARALHIGLGDVVSNLTETKRTRPIVIKGKEVKNASPLWSFAWYPDSPRTDRQLLEDYGVRRALPDHSFSVQRVLEVAPDSVEATWDLEVEGAHNFAADGLIVHNSELQEWTAHQVGLYLPDGAMNQLAYCRQQGTAISVAEGLRTPAALLFHGPSDPHVASSLGDSEHTFEARGRKYPVGVFAGARSRPWTAAAKVPGLASVTQAPFRRLVKLGDRGGLVGALQYEMVALAGQNLLGEDAQKFYGPATQNAVVNITRFFTNFMHLPGFANHNGVGVDATLFSTIDLFFAQKTGQSPIPG